MRNTPVLRGLLVVAAMLSPLPVAAQDLREWDPGEAYMPREVLEDMLEHLDLSASSPAYSAVLRSRIREQAALIRSRLEVGDFQVGDRIVLEVEDQPMLSDTFTVDQGRVLTLPTIGDVPLTGVLRSELKDHVAEYLTRFIREPVVRARALIQVAVLGAVARPGFYAVAGEALLSDAVMLAGGPAGNAKIDEIRIERQGVPIWEGRPLQEAIVGGRTLDELNLRAGDWVFVPQPSGGNLLQSFGVLTGLTLSLAGILQILSN